MATLTVWKFDTATGAEDAIHVLERLQKEQLITVHDAALATWPEGKKKPKTRQLNNLAGAGALGGAFWGLLFGLLFFVPLLGMAVGAAVGALSGSLVDVGIDDRFVDDVLVEASGGLVEASGVIVAMFRGSRATHIRCYYDGLGLLEQVVRPPLQ